MCRIRSRTDGIMFHPEVRIEFLLLAGVVFLGLQAGAYASATFQVASTPVTAVSNTDNTARAGDITFTVLSGSSSSGPITINYPAAITCPFSAITVIGTGGFLSGVSINNADSSNIAGRLIINVPAGGNVGDHITVSGVRLQIAGSGMSGPVNAGLTSVNNFIVAGQTMVTVISAVVHGIAFLSGTAGEINGTTGAVTVLPIVGAREGHMMAFANQGTGDTTSVMVRFTLDQAPPLGVTVSFPPSASMGSRVWTTADSSGNILNTAINVTNSNWVPVHYSISGPDPFLIETLSVPVTLTVSSSALPLAPVTVSYTASLAPIGPAFDLGGVILAPVPRFAASEVGPATLFSVTPTPPPVAILLNPAGGTNEYKFPDDVFNHYNYKVIYPAFPPPPAPVDLVVEPIFITQAELTARLGGQFPGATLVPYDHTGGHGVLFRTSCKDHVSHLLTTCPTPGVYDVKTSWDSPVGQTISNPAFLKLPGGTGTWENIFTAFSQTRTDPTGSGRTADSYSDFVFVDNVTGAPPGIEIKTPPDGAIYAVNQSVNANYSCTGGSSVVSSCLGTVPSGSPIYTLSKGNKTFEVNAVVSGGPSADKTVAYYVRKFGILLLYVPSKPVWSGLPVAIVLQLTDAHGHNVSSRSAALKATSIVPAGTMVGGTPQPAGFSKSCKDFVYFPWPGSGEYIYAVNTIGLKRGSYSLLFTVSADPGSTYAVPFQIK